MKIRGVLILICLLIAFSIFGCSPLDRKFTKSLTFSGKSQYWDSVLVYQYVEDFIPADKETINHRKAIRKSYKLTFKGSPINRAVRVHYEFINEFGEVFMDGNCTLSNLDKENSIKGTGIGVASSSVPAIQINEIVLGSTQGRFPDRNEKILLKIIWEGQEETLNLTTD